ncbi:MAG TPA: outer membrane beta-barrel protein [Gemmatimonadaceae bacterium]|nr:outer membrane beta-barrel protein [Gemmatimonadaceae bacterium]
MKRTLVGSALVLTAVAAVAMPAQAQRRTSFGFAAGATIPTGDLGDAVSTGFHALGTLAISGSASAPVGFRIDGMYNSLSGKSSGPDLTIWSVNGNLVFAFPGASTVTPYLIGGAGWYNTKADQDGAESSNNFGLNGGVGARFALSGFSTFAEVRFHNIFGEKNELTDKRPSLRIIPLTFGIMF